MDKYRKSNTGKGSGSSEAAFDIEGNLIRTFLRKVDRRPFSSIYDTLDEMSRWLYLIGDDIKKKEDELFEFYNFFENIPSPGYEMIKSHYEGKYPFILQEGERIFIKKELQEYNALSSDQKNEVVLLCKEVIQLSEYQVVYGSNENEYFHFELNGLERESKRDVYYLMENIAHMFNEKMNILFLYPDKNESVHVSGVCTIEHFWYEADEETTAKLLDEFFGICNIQNGNYFIENRIKKRFLVG